MHHFQITGKEKGLLRKKKADIGLLHPEVQSIIQTYREIEKEAKDFLKTKIINANGLPTERFVNVKARVYQDVLKRHLLDIYSSQCSCCEIDQKELLVASHIIPWSKDEARRLDPQNCILLCKMHDALFDKGFITFNEKYEVLISKKLSENTKAYAKNVFLRLPSSSIPNVEYLRLHHDEIFRK